MAKSSPSIWQYVVIVKSKGEDFVKLCGLLRKQKLWTKLFWIKFHENTFFSDTNETKTGYADLEPQFTLKKKDGEKLLYQCNICKPSKVISVNVKSRSNLKRHLSGQHSKKDVENYEGIKKRKKENLSSGSLVQVTG